MKVSLRKKPNTGKISRKLSLTNTKCRILCTKSPCWTSSQCLFLFSFHKIHQYFPKQGMKLVIFHPILEISLLNQKLLVQSKNHAWGHCSTLGLFSLCATAEIYQFEEHFTTWREQIKAVNYRNSIQTPVHSADVQIPIQLGAHWFFCLKAPWDVSWKIPGMKTKQGQAPVFSQ